MIRSDERTENRDLRHTRDWPLELCAYRVGPSAPKIVPASSRREWMDETLARFANRCVPMSMANQCGWFILNDYTVRVSWNGDPTPSGVTVAYEHEQPDDPPVVSHFGHGIVTWRIPILFRTPPGLDLWVRGPVNRPKEGVYPLEGLVETSWAVATFTMNWKLMAVDHPVTFEKDEPVCMIVPHRTDDIENLMPITAPIEGNQTLEKAFREWSISRDEHLRTRTDVKDWQRDYIRGRSGESVVAPQHRTRVKVKAFREAQGSAEAF